VLQLTGFQFKLIRGPGKGAVLGPLDLIFEKLAMVFVGRPFRHDVFVSYSHGDVLGDGQALLKQWSQGFARELELELRAFPDLGRHINVFLDQSYRPEQGLDPMAPLSDNLKREVSTSAVLALLMSPQYLGSPWCSQEREWWIESQRAHSISHKGRMAVARIWPTNDAPWPATLVDDEGHQQMGRLFYEPAKADIRPQPFSWPSVDSSTGPPFRDALLDFVGRIRIRLIEIKQALDALHVREAERQRLEAPEGQVLYLYGRDTHARHWDRVNEELEADGYIVFPNRPEPVESDPKRIRELQAERIRTMSGSDAILVVGTEDINALTADLAVIGRLDRHQAVAQSNRSLPCGVVDTAGVLQQFAKLPLKAKALGVDWFDASIPPWTAILRSWLKTAGAAR
jgi:hypothetical protein